MLFIPALFFVHLIGWSIHLRSLAEVCYPNFLFFFWLEAQNYLICDELHVNTKTNKVIISTEINKVYNKLKLWYLLYHPQDSQTAQYKVSSRHSYLPNACSPMKKLSLLAMRSSISTWLGVQLRICVESCSIIVLFLFSLFWIGAH